MCNINLIIPPIFLAGMKPVYCGILAIAKEHISLLDKCVAMKTKISLTACETPLTETYMTFWNIRHGNKNDIQNE